MYINNYFYIIIKLMVENSDIINYINSANDDNKSGKRKKNKISYEDTLYNFKILAIDRLIKLDQSHLRLTGVKLISFIKNLILLFKQLINNLKNNSKLNNNLTESTTLYIIAELSICIYFLNLINKSLNNNIDKDKISFEDYLNKFQNKLLKNPYKIQKLESDSFAFYIEPESESDQYQYEYENENENIIDNEYHILNYDIIGSIFNKDTSNIESNIINYYNNLAYNNKKDIVDNITEITNYNSLDKPLLFKILELPLCISQKNFILNTYKTLETSLYPDNKLRLWFESLMKIPFGKYKGIDLINPSEINMFLLNLENIMNEAVHGHETAKRQIIQIMGHQVKNIKSKGNVIGLWGPPGTGKTSLIKEGIAKAMGKPFVFISLGGATDASFLEGHSYTYEGSIYGRIVNGLISCQCMDPIIYFDELDKISKTYKGEEITNILIHLTDPVQNTNFRDKYFHGIDIDLSRATFIFSYNDPRNINPILLDRITSIETKFLLLSQKLHIVNNYLLPDILKDINYSNNDIIIDDSTIKFLINTYTHEGGIRKLKSLLYNIIREINIKLLTDLTIVKPFIITNKNIKKFLCNNYEYKPDIINSESKIGIVYGLYAGSYGVGGILPIQAMLIPSQTAMTIKATGNLEKVIKESVDVACSLAWECIDSELKDKYYLEWKDKPQGFHIHCPDGAVPKDGPSAGAALTLVLYSLLTNKKINNYIAMTGEINLEGNITAIGGLEEKLEGAKRSGIKLVLVPKENENDLIKIKKRNETLIDDTFQVKLVETINDVLKEALV